MSKISLIYDAYLAFLTTHLTGYARITNGLSPENTPSVILRKGFAFIPREGTNTERQICGKRSYARLFDVVLVNQITATENNFEAFDTIVKNIHEDVANVFQEMEKTTTLNDITNGLGNTKMIGDTGLEFSAGDGALKYFQISLTFETEYFETF